MTFCTSAFHPTSVSPVFKTTRYFLYDILSLLYHGNDLPASCYWNSSAFVASVITDSIRKQICKEFCKSLSFFPISCLCCHISTVFQKKRWKAINYSFMKSSVVCIWRSNLYGEARKVHILSDCHRPLVNDMGQLERLSTFSCLQRVQLKYKCFHIRNKSKSNK